MKLTGLGLKLDLELCHALLEGLVRDAAARGSFVRIDMEDADLRRRHARALPARCVGWATTTSASSSRPTSSARSTTSPTCVSCARASGSARASTSSPPRSPSGTPEVVRRSFVAASTHCSTGGSRVAIATHDEALIAASLERVASLAPDGLRVPDAARRAGGPGDGARRRRAIRCGSTSPTGSAGTSTRSGACRRTRRWRG